MSLFSSSCSLLLECSVDFVVKRYTFKIPAPATVLEMSPEKAVTSLWVSTELCPDENELVMQGVQSPAGVFFSLFVNFFFWVLIVLCRCACVHCNHSAVVSTALRIV